MSARNSANSFQEHRSEVLSVAHVLRGGMVERRAVVIHGAMPKRKLPAVFLVDIVRKRRPRKPHVAFGGSSTIRKLGSPANPGPSNFPFVIEELVGNNAGRTF